MSRLRRRWRERRQDFLLRAHDAEGKKLFGKKWKKANIGWWEAEGTISSKIYGPSPKIFTTCLWDKGNQVVHEIRDYLFG